VGGWRLELRRLRGGAAVWQHARGEGGGIDMEVKARWLGINLVGCGRGGKPFGVLSALFSTVTVSWTKVKMGSFEVIMGEEL
jgi:hypothetical protein